MRELPMVFLGSLAIRCVRIFGGIKESQGDLLPIHANSCSPAYGSIGKPVKQCSLHTGMTRFFHSGVPCILMSSTHPEIGSLVIERVSVGVVYKNSGVRDAHQQPVHGDVDCVIGAPFFPSTLGIQVSPGMGCHVPRIAVYKVEIGVLYEDVFPANSKCHIFNNSEFAIAPQGVW